MTSTSASAVVIDGFAHDDIPAVLAIDAQVYPETWSAALLADDIDKENRHHLVARLEGKVVGHGSLMTLADEGHITTVAVDPTYQRQGIARRLVLALCREGVRQGLSLLTLEVRATNRSAQRLYSGFGFAPVGARPKYYAATNNGPAEDALLYTAHDIASDDYRTRLDGIEAAATNEERS